MKISELAFPSEIASNQRGRVSLSQWESDPNLRFGSNKLSYVTDTHV